MWHQQFCKLAQSSAQVQALLDHACRGLLAASKVQDDFTKHRVDLRHEWVTSRTVASQFGVIGRMVSMSGNLEIDVARSSLLAESTAVA